MNGSSGTRERILAATAALLAEDGRDAVSTRAVAEAAGVQAPAIYRLFGDKQGLLDAVVVRGFEVYLAETAERAPTGDPVEDLRAGWDLHVGFGLAHPAVYALMYFEPAGGGWSPAATAAFETLAALIRRIAAAGRLRMPVERAAQLVHAAGYGTTSVLIATRAEHRDPALSTTAREAVIAAIATDAPVTSEPGATGAAVALRATLEDARELSPSERGLLAEWLDRIAGRP